MHEVLNYHFVLLEVQIVEFVHFYFRAIRSVGFIGTTRVFSMDFANFAHFAGGNDAEILSLPSSGLLF